MDLRDVDLEGAPTAEVLPAEHAAERLPGVGVPAVAGVSLYCHIWYGVGCQPVEDVNLEVSLLTGRDVGAVRTVPAAERLHHHDVRQAVLNRQLQNASHTNWH